MKNSSYKSIKSVRTGEDNREWLTKNVKNVEKKSRRVKICVAMPSCKSFWFGSYLNQYFVGEIPCGQFRHKEGGCRGPGEATGGWKGAGWGLKGAGWSYEGLPICPKMINFLIISCKNSKFKWVSSVKKFAIQMSKFRANGDVYQSTENGPIFICYLFPAQN